MYQLKLFIATVYIAYPCIKNQRINGLAEGLIIKKELYVDNDYRYEYCILRRNWLVNAKYIYSHTYMVANSCILDSNNIIIMTYLSDKKLNYFRFITNKIPRYLLYQSVLSSKYFIECVYPSIRNHKNTIMNVVDSVFCTKFYKNW